MRPQFIMFLGWIASAGTLISLTFGGDWLGSNDLDVVNSLTVFKEANLLNVWTITIPNVDFMFTGLKSLMMLDFGFFTGPLQLVQWVLFFVIIAAATWGIYTVIITVATSAIRR